VRAALVASVILFGSLSPNAGVAGNLVKDGGLDKPAPPPGQYAVYNLGQSIGRWVVVGPTGSNVALTSTSFTQGGFSFPAQHGLAFVDLTGVDDNGTPQGISQSVKTVVGTEYKLTFSVGNVDDPNGPYGTSSTVNVYNGQSLLLSATYKGGKGKPKLVWKRFTTTFTAASATTALSFINGDPSGDKMCGLDSISLIALAPAR
jgi:hypothetical protein